MSERRVEIVKWIEGVRSGDFAEVFACCTAASISPIGVLKGHDFSFGDADA
ncbi:branched-subunit amino acid aminotransferase/4-amino-4-deoxychorismate lyase [Luteimonas sp. 3794]|nr:branched-subunit amino acid aminotransferase/4-amino-4-deoxychorismate lyase [Luteimonas sp. 3794]